MTKEDDFDWNRQSGSTSTADTGPRVDVTLGSGELMLHLYYETVTGYNVFPNYTPIQVSDRIFIREGLKIWKQKALKRKTCL